MTASDAGREVGRALYRLGHARPLRTALLNPIVARPGYWFATIAALAWGAILGRATFSRRGGVIIAPRMPKWAFGRGGTTVGAVFLTATDHSDSVIEHEAVHKEQWKRYGLAFIPLYLLAGQDAKKNRFEVEAGLKKGGYV